MNTREKEVQTAFDAGRATRLRDTEFKTNLNGNKLASDRYPTDDELFEAFMQGWDAGAGLRHREVGYMGDVNGPGCDPSTRMKTLHVWRQALHSYSRECAKHGDLSGCVPVVHLSDYDALAARLAEAERDRDDLLTWLRNVATDAQLDTQVPALAMSGRQLLIRAADSAQPLEPAVPSSADKGSSYTPVATRESGV